MKNAPNVKQLPDDEFTEAVIFAGVDAWIHAKNWQAGNPAKDTTPPVVLDSKQLSVLNNLRIIDDGRRFARVYRAGKLTELQISTIATKLAIAGVTSACFYSESYELLEDWTKRLSKMKEDAASGNSVSLQLQAIDGGKKRRSSEDLDLSQMAASQRGKVLAEYHGEIAVNPESETAYVYTGSVWEKVADSELRRTMGAIFDQRDTPYSPKGIDAAIDAMKLQIPVIGKQRRELIGFENGAYDLISGQFSAHRADNWLMNHNGITFTPPCPGENLKDHAPHFYRWLTHSAGTDQQKASRIKAALFMILANRYDWQLFIEITGEGGSGKSVFSSIATILAGEHNTASGNMAALDSARGRAQFVGKSLITLPDQTRYVGEGAGIKAITGGDLIEIDGKYEKQFSTIIQAVVLATNNEPMAFTERNGGIARRRVIFPFNIPVRDEEKDPNLIAKIRCEIPVVIRCLLSDFADQNRAKALLTEQRDSAEAMGVKRHSDPLYGFCEHIVALGEAVGMMMGNLNISPRAPRIYLYHAYLAYMDAHGFDKHLTLTRFGSDFPKVMKEYGSEYKKAKTNAGMRYNMELGVSADDWLPALPRQPEDMR